MKPPSALSSIVSKTGLVAIFMLSLPTLPLALALPAHAETTQPAIVAQNNPFNNVDDGVLPLITDTMRMVESARKAMNSTDPEVKRMAQETYELGMKKLEVMMAMWMRRNAVRNTSPR
jgi:hypothetical protein